MGRGGKKPVQMSTSLEPRRESRLGQRQSAQDSPAIAGYFANRQRIADKLAEESYFTHHIETPHFPEEELFLYVAPMIMEHTQGTVVSETGFEKMFKNIKKYVAAQNPGARATIIEAADSATNPGADFYALEEEVKVGISFKTESSGKISPNSGRIAKFLESSNGVGGIKNRGDAVKYLGSVLEHMDNYRYIYFLRVRRDPENNRVLYTMHEVPYDILRGGIENLTLDDFSKLTGDIRRTSAIVKNKKGEKFAKMIFDKSGNKVTLEQIDMDQCPMVAEWDIKTEPDFFN